MDIKELNIGDRVEGLFKVNIASDIYDGVWIPLEVIKEYECFWLCKVLPHKNPKHCWGTSHPYNMTIGKFELKSGYVKCRPIGESNDKSK